MRARSSGGGRECRRQRSSAQWRAFHLVLTMVASAVVVAPSGLLASVETERLYLSGHGPEDARPWEFRIDRGRRAGVWTTIPVPSQWELHGFGAYSYGLEDTARSETGTYRLRFTPPESWHGRRIDLVFEGAMTDTEVRLNGTLLGRHQGGYTRFAFEVGERLEWGRENELTAVVFEASTDPSVNAAERDADYWTLGGIYRPVFLESRPTPGIGHVTLDARHDGRIDAEIEVEGQFGGTEVSARVLDDAGQVVGALAEVDPERPGGKRRFAADFVGVRSWSAEAPALYHLEIELWRGRNLLHRVRRRFGFRTIELRPGGGLFVNDRRTLLKGINRHSFWPSTGRALDAERNRKDVLLIKELNANAVRSSHYPPDEAFLDACDELGLYVIDELPGWHDAYRERVGRRLIGEMVRRDVNHPSVIMWANGNEGGWNRRLDSEFHRHDPQRRQVIHPGAVFAGVDARHYPSWNELVAMLRDDTVKSFPGRWLPIKPLVVPTEMLHGLYDGGLGAGLEDFWRLLRGSPRTVGGFLWALLDEAVVRTDRAGELDTHGNHAPDGIVGAFRDKEAGFAAVRSVWSPVVATAGGRASAGDFVMRVENRYAHLDLEDVSFRWRWLRWPEAERGGAPIELEGGETRGPRAAAGSEVDLVLPLLPEADAVEVEIVDQTGRPVDRWVFPAISDSGRTNRRPGGAGPGAGRPLDAARALERLGLERAALPAAAETSTSWSLHQNGWLRLEIERGGAAREPLEGVAFAHPGERLRSVEFLGYGPEPVWRNRLAGPRLGVWRSRPVPGFYRGVYWARFELESAVLVVVLEGGDLYLSLSGTSFPADARHARAPTPPPETLGFFLEIPAIGSKFHSARALAPPGVEPTSGAVRAAVWLRRLPAVASE